MTAAKKYVPFNKRPKCQTPGCDNTGQHQGIYLKDGSPVFRAFCSICHSGYRRENYRKKLLAVDRRKLAKCAVMKCKKRVEVFGTDKKGKLKYTTYCKDHACMINAYLIYRKDYCENIDGRLGFICSTNVIWEGMLDTDHMDGDPFNNDPANLQTLCKCCHAYKTNQNKDYATPGRKGGRGLFTRLLD